MNEDDAAAVVALLDPLLRALEMLTFISRHLHPPDFEELMASIGAPDEELRSALAQAVGMAASTCPASGLRSMRHAMLRSQAFIGLREALQQGGDVRDVYRALRIVPKGLEALYPLAGILPPVNQFFLDPSLRSDEAAAAFPRRLRPRQHRGHALRREGARWVLALRSGDTIWPTAPGRLSWRCMAAAEPGACFSGAGCAMRAAAAPFWWRRLRLAAPGP